MADENEGLRIFSEPRRLERGQEGIRVPRDTLEAIWGALDRALGDTDADWYESEEERRRDNPLLWAAQQVGRLILQSIKLEEGERVKMKARFAGKKRPTIKNEKEYRDPSDTPTEHPAAQDPPKEFAE